MKRMGRFLYIMLVFAGLLVFNVQVFASEQNSGHPRIYASGASKADFIRSANKVQWKKEIIDKKIERLEKYIELCEQDPEWLVSRLQMNWKTKHDKVFLKKGDFSHSSGSAPVPTVRYSGSRDWATDYATPKLEDVIPYFDDERGMYVKHKKTGKMEWVHPSKVGHMIESINRNIMSLVEDAAFLYWYTGDETYAKFASPVFFTYIEGMYYRDAPEDLLKSNQNDISGLATFEVIHEKIVLHLTLSYDFLYDYFKSQNKDLQHSIAVFQKWGDQIINNGIPDNNWNLFQARFLTFIALALENDEEYENGKGQQYFLRKTFDESSIRQRALKESLLVYDQETGIWPESPSYSVHVITTLLEILTVLDNASNANELANFPIIEKATLAAFQYLFPSGQMLGFGDSKHSSLPPENFELLIANYHKYHNEEKEILLSKFLNKQIEKGEYRRGGSSLFELFFYVDKLKTGGNNAGVNTLMTPTFYASNVSMFVQRMGQGDKAMMVSTVGSFGNHSHANGISMELYANNYVLAPDMGKGPSYWHEDHRNYYNKMPAHNTVVVNGRSDYGAMRGYYPYTLDNSFPRSGELHPVFSNVSFNKSSFVEPKTKADQARLTAMLKTNSGGGYVVDVFRSRTQSNTSQKHDYFYHNLGQSVDVFDAKGLALKLNKSHRLTAKNGELKAYDYHTDETSCVYNDHLTAQFLLKTKKHADNIMKLWIKGCENQQIISALAPPSNALTKGSAPAEMLNKNIPTLVLRREDAAWENPFVVVFNPFVVGDENPISQVDFKDDLANPASQKIVVDHSNGITHDEIVVNTTQNDECEQEGFYQKGLLSVLRKTDKQEWPDFIFVSGMYKFKYLDWELTSLNMAFSASIEKSNEGLIISNDGPVLIKVPVSKAFRGNTLELYENGKKVEERKGMISRSNPNQLEYRLSLPYKKAFIRFSE